MQNYDYLSRILINFCYSLMLYRYFYYLCGKLKYIINTANINRIKVVLVEKGKTGKWLAGQIGTSACTVSKWCSNASQPDLKSLVRIAEILEVDKPQIRNC